MIKSANQRGASSAPTSVAFKLSPVAAGCAMLLSAISGSAYAQDATAGQAADAPVIQTVKVSGIRRGIEDAISVKKNSESIVEAISAEDIGKLPDVSIAESLSRLPGVAAQRVAGRAQVLSIRGLAPDFSTTTLNGREQASTGDNRSVEYDQYPSELINGAVVYKTPDASLVGQGLSGTVDLQTVRPLEFPGRTMAINVRGEKNSIGKQNAGYKDKGYRLSGIYIDQFNNRTLGVALGYARLDSPGQYQKWSSWGYGFDPKTGSTTGLANSGNEIDAGSTKQTRDGLMAVVQWKPNRDFQSMVDTYYSKFDSDTTIRGMQFGTGNWMGGLTYANPIFASYGGTQVLQSATVGGIKPVLRNDLNTNRDKLFAIGWNNKLRMNEDWTGMADFSYSKADRQDMILETYAGASGNDSAKIVRDNNTGLPQVTTGLNYADPSVVKLSDSGGWGQDGYVKYPQVTDKLKSARFSAKRSLDGMFSNLDVGVNFTKRDKTRQSAEMLVNLKNGRAPIGVPSNLIQDPTSLGFAGIPGILSYDIMGAVNSLYTLTPKIHQDIYNKDWLVSEKVSTAYAKVGIDDTWGVPVKGNFGVQMIHTNQSSNAFNVDTNGLNKPKSVDEGTSYNDFLPSLNLNFDLGSEQHVRFGLGKTMARPRLDQLRASSSASVDTTKLTWTGDGGNPKLKPWRANAIDLTYEKYFDKSTYFSAATFYKKLSTYIYDQIVPFDYTSYPNDGVTPKSNIGTLKQPANGTGGSIKGVELSGSIDGKVLWTGLDGFGATGSISRTKSEIAPDGPGTTGALPGLSRTVSNVQFFYEKSGYSARVTRSERSNFRGEVTGFGADRTFTDIKGAAQVDFQVGYEFKEGQYKGLSLLFQVINANDAAYQTTLSNGTLKVPGEYTKYGRTMLLGLNYKM
ncbi:TonB-dependent receptor [Duganella sp. BJB1802]|uniref:TonB-dependent receptor n=1 Tax=Duganella sp. BJB1802 TaxID=2744575 RepID=UPI001593B05E|nr:TonB-dependent receptor [Duganella sp. BJB1802]NVD73659.1 TonB-dependent receptor [Duganella sp. BJB1802]